MKFESQEFSVRQFTKKILAGGPGGGAVKNKAPALHTTAAQAVHPRGFNLETVSRP